MRDINANHSLQRFPANALWRLLIDGNRQETSGPLGFDKKEPGYLKGMMHGLNSVFTDDAPLSVELLATLHSQCVEPVRVVQYAESESGTLEFRAQFQQGVYNAPKSFGLIPDGPCKNFTREGLAELCDRLLKGDTSFYFEKNGTTEQINATNLQPLDVDDLYKKLESGDWAIATTNSPRKNPIQNQLNAIISQYKQDIKQAHSNDAKIKVIATCIHDLELAHPFSDANCRTIVVLLLNKLLLDENLPPVILENPNRFDAYSIEELCQEIHRGMDKLKTYSSSNEDAFSNETVIYLKDNPALQKFVVEQALANCGNWSLVNPTEKQRAIELIMKALKELNIDELTPKKLQDITKNLSNLVNQSIYKKNFLQTILGSHHNHGIRFAGDLGSWGGLQLHSIQTALNECIKPTKSFADYKKISRNLREEASTSTQKKVSNDSMPKSP